MHSTDILDEAQAHVREAQRQLAAWGRASQEVQAALAQCGHTLAACPRPVLQGDPAAGEGLAAASRALEGAAQTVPDTLAQMHTALTEHLTQARGGVATLVEAWDAAAQARPDLATEEAALHARLTHLHQTYAARAAEAEAQHQARLEASAEALARVERQIAEARRLRDQLTAL